jgi:hypothetical protein
MEHLGEINFDKETLKPVWAAKLDYLIQPCIAFDKHLKRLYKYINIGFSSMLSITFSDSCSPEYVQFITGQFHHMQAFPMSVNALMDLHIERQIAIIFASDFIVPTLTIESLIMLSTVMLSIE